MSSHAETELRGGGEPGTAPAARAARPVCRCGNPGRVPDRPSGCATVRDTPIRKPDLAIYSQDEQLANGGLPSWDNPDIITNDWRPFRLMDEAKVTVRNLSATTAAANALVHCSTSPFGIGTRRQLRLTRAVSLGPSQQAELLFPLHQEVLSGDPRTGVHIRIEHPNDPVSINNAGSQVHDGGYTTESGRDFEIEVPVLNDSGLSRQIDLIILSTDLLVTVTPSSHFFAPFQQITAIVRIRVPSFLSGSASNVIERGVTIIGQVPGGPIIGGVTRLLRIDS